MRALIIFALVAFLAVTYVSANESESVEDNASDVQSDEDLEDLSEDELLQLLAENGATLNEDGEDVDDAQDGDDIVEDVNDDEDDEN